MRRLFLSHSTRVRGLKYGSGDITLNINSSHSTRVRGLKFCLFRPSFQQPSVALYTSAWIEIPIHHPLAFYKRRRTLHECVD